MHIAERCISLTKSLGLKISGIDLIHAAGGQFYCLEANPNPAFAAFDLDTRAEVAQRMARAWLEHSLRRRPGARFRCTERILPHEGPVSRRRNKPTIACLTSGRVSF